MTGPLYIAEQLPLDWRGPMTVCYQLLITIGILTGSILAGLFEPVPNGWRLVSLTAEYQQELFRISGNVIHQPT